MSLEDFVAAQAAFTPLNLRGVSLQKSDTQWSDIGGTSHPPQSPPPSAPSALPLPLLIPASYPTRRPFHLLMNRSSRSPTCPPRNARMANQIRSDIRQLPSSPQIRSATIRLSWLWQNTARFRRCERVRSELYIRQRARDTEQVYRSIGKVCQGLV